MNIRELLSPQDSPAAETPPQRLSPSPHASPNKRSSGPSRQHWKSSGLTTSFTQSPTPQDVQLPSIAAHDNHQQFLLPVASVTSAPYPGLSTQHSPNHQPPESGVSSAHPAIHRQFSTPQMDKLAELASMQQHHHHHHHQQQGAGQNSNSTQDVHLPDTQRLLLKYVLRFNALQIQAAC